MHVVRCIAERSHLLYLFLGLHLLGEGGIEILQGLGIVAFAEGDLVELFLHLGGEGIAHDVGEMFLEEGTHHVPGIRDTDRPTLLDDVLAVIEGLDDGSVGTWAADATLLEFFHETGFRVPSGRFGLLLLGRKILEGDCLTGGDGSEENVVVLGSDIADEPPGGDDD